MIDVDSSVWIDYFGGRNTRPVEVLGGLVKSSLLIGDLIMTEVLQGFRRETDFRKAQQTLAAFEFRSMLGRETAVAAALNYRSLRERGVTPRNTIDTIIATFCVLNGHLLLYNDRDFEHFERHLGLRVVTE